MMVLTDQAELNSLRSYVQEVGWAVARMNKSIEELQIQVGGWWVGRCGRAGAVDGRMCSAWKQEL